LGADPLLDIDPQYIALAKSVAVDWHDAVDHIESLLDRQQPVDPQFVAELLPLLRAGELLDGWSEPWVTAERQRYRAMRKAARDTLGHVSEKPVVNHTCGTIRSLHARHPVRKTNKDSREP